MEEKALDAHYAYEFKGIRLDPYRIMQVYKKITHPAHQHAFKKLLRAGESVKPLKQDIREVIMTLERWLEMIEEEEGVEKQVNFSQESLLDWITRDATKGGWTPSPDQVLTGTGGHVGTIPRDGGMRLGTELGGIAYCSDFGSYSLGNYDGLNPPESNHDLGATNRLKPVEDKAEVKEGEKVVQVKGCFNTGTRNFRAY